MGLSYDLISEFVKITNDKKENTKEGTVYATVVSGTGGKYVQIDGSDLLTPMDTTTDIEDGERVTLMIKDHKAIVTGNVTTPSASTSKVDKVTESINSVSDRVGTFELVVADKISTKELEAYKATIEILVAKKATIEDLTATNAKIENLEVKNAEIENLVAEKATITDLEAVNATIENLKAKDAEIENAVVENLKATIADIKILNADFAQIKTLVNGNLTSDNILSFNLTSEKVTVDDAFIKDAMIDTISAGKINSGKINTNFVSIGSEDGGMLITGSTQQFMDKNGNVRIQIGKDASGDFTFVLYGEDGKGQLINQNGITASAIGDGLIVNDMVSDHAAISGGKLDISSVITEINSDNSTTIKSSKIYLNDQAQSLEVAFNSLKTRVDTIQEVTIQGDLTAIVEQVQSNTSKIEANKNSINTLISEDTVIKKQVTDLQGTLNETETTLNSKYTALNQNLDGFKTTVADTYATKKSVTDVVDNIETNYSTTSVMNSAIKQKAQEISASVSSTYATKNQVNTLDNNLKTNYSTTQQMESAINIAKEAINLGVSSIYETKENSTSKIQNAVNNIQVGGTNLLWGTKLLTAGIHLDSYITSDTYLGFKIMHYKQTADGFTDTYIYNQCIAFEPNTEYTLSFYAKGSGVIYSFLYPDAVAYGENSIGNTTNSTDGNTITTVTNEWKRYWITWKTLSDMSGSKNLIISRIYKGNDIYICGAKLEKGNKATEWSPAPEDIDTSINNAKTEAITSANNTLTSTISNYYTKSQTDSQINVAKNAITQSVSSTYATKTNVTSSINGVNSSISNLQNRMSSAESKITDTAITNTVKKNFYTKTETENAITSKGYATQSQVQQTANDITFKFSQSGGYNLIRNGGFENGGAHWSRNNNPSITENQIWQNYHGKSIFISAAGYGSGIYQHFSTVPGKIYSYSFYAQAERGTWYAGVENLHTQDIAVSPNNWRRYTGTFTATNTTQAFICYAHGSDRNVFLDNVIVCEGALPSEYTPHPSEIYDGITTIDKTGVRVSASNMNGYTHMTEYGFYVNKGGKDLVSVDRNGLQLFDAKIQLTHANGNKYFLLDENGIIMYNPANGTHQWGKVAAINNKFTIASNGNSSGLSLGHHVDDNYVEDILCDSYGYLTVHRQMNHNGIYYNNYGQIFIRQPGQSGWEITGRSDSQSIKPGGANQGSLGSSTQYINNSWVAIRNNPSSIEIKHVSHYVKDNECISLVNGVQPARYFYKEYDEEGNDITTFASRSSQLGLIYEDVRECSARDLITNEEDKGINLYGMVSVLWGATRNVNTRLNDAEYEIVLLKEEIEYLKNKLCEK